MKVPIYTHRPPTTVGSDSSSYSITTFVHKKVPSHIQVTYNPLT